MRPMSVQIFPTPVSCLNDRSAAMRCYRIPSLSFFFLHYIRRNLYLLSNIIPTTVSIPDGITEKYSKIFSTFLCTYGVVTFRHAYSNRINCENRTRGDPAYPLVHTTLIFYVFFFR